MYPISPNINITYQTLPLLGKLAYNLNGVENNPTLELVRGYTYELTVTVPPEHSVWIKSQIGTASNGVYNLGVIGNGTSSIKWRVDANAPTRLIYQSYSSTEIAGSILIKDTPSSLPSGVANYADLKQALDTLQESLSYSPVNIAGQGLSLTGTALTLSQGYLQYLQDTNGQIYTTGNSFTAVDDPVALSTPPHTLQEYLNYLAASLRQIKGTASYTTVSPSDCLTLNNRIDNLELEVRYLISKIPTS